VDKLIVEGGHRLNGEIAIAGAKNAALPVLAATLLAAGTSRIENVPRLRDTVTIRKLLEALGVEVTVQEDCFTVDASTVKEHEAPYELVKTMRASILVLGPLVARHGRARVSLPGGCALGPRPVNLHLSGLRALGAEISLEHGYVVARAEELSGARIVFDQVTVTGTENILMAACLARGESEIVNAAREPEVTDLAQALQDMGAKIEGAGTSTIRVQGVPELRGVHHRVMPDRIEAGTYLVAGAICGGPVRLKNAQGWALGAVVEKLRQSGAIVEDTASGLQVHQGAWPPTPLTIRTEPYPGFPTDMQAQFMTYLCLAAGTSVVEENIFENRFMHVCELQRLGARIDVSGRRATVTGVGHLDGAKLMATDIRASASLILAGLAARGQTEISRVYHIDRGYERIEERLSALGARIWRARE
jgi:UDP-N-acetylglucosamine 1-carboxyvinyltransferase